MALLDRSRRRTRAGDSRRLPAQGELVWISMGRSGERLRGRVDQAQAGSLGLVLTGEAGPSLRRRRKCELEWVVAGGLVRAHGRIGGVRAGPPPVLEIAVKGQPRLVQRRAYLRVASALEVSGWSLQDPTRLLSGRTVDLSTSGALLHLPMVPETVTTFELRISLPDGALHALGHVVRRAVGDLVAVRLEPKRAYDVERLARFVSARLRDEGPVREHLP